MGDTQATGDAWLLPRQHRSMCDHLRGHAQFFSVGWGVGPVPEVRACTLTMVLVLAAGMLLSERKFASQPQMLAMVCGWTMLH